MVAVPSRHRSLLLLGIVVLAQVLLLAVQIKSEHQLRLIRVWTVSLVSPIQKAGAWTIDHIRSGWSNYVALVHLREENEQLQADLNRLKLRNSELEGKAAEAERLSVLLGFREAHGETPMLPARVIGASPDSSSRTIYINRGEADGVRKNMPVMTPDGVIGRVIESYPESAQVMLISDKESGVGALLASTRTEGPILGTNEPLLLLKYITNEEKVSVGERVLTSGQDRIFPKDLPVGTVAEVKPGSPFQTIRVQPAAHLNRLEEVLVLLTRQELQPNKSPAPAPKNPPGPGAAPNP